VAVYAGDHEGDDDLLCNLLAELDSPLAAARMLDSLTPVFRQLLKPKLMHSRCRGVHKLACPVEQLGANEDKWKTGQPLGEGPATHPANESS
jgi:hypothetical protein